MDDDLAFATVSPLHADAQWALTQYFDELRRRFPAGFDPGDASSVDAASMSPPDGTFVVARVADQVVGCGGVRRIPPIDSDPKLTSVAEIKRMWVSSDVRGRGVGSRLLAHLEAAAWRAGHTIIRLDTNEVLGEAIAMYRRCGYRDIEPYNTSDKPTHWFEKSPPDQRHLDAG